MDRGAWWAVVLGAAELDTTEWLTLSLSHPPTVTIMNERIGNTEK